MADINKMNRTWLCSVLFLDIVNYSSQSVELQIRWKERFNGYLANAIKDVPDDERVILDTGDGAATCFLGAPEAAMFSALELWHSLLIDERDQQPPFRVRIGINLGPVKLVRDINGAPNAIGDGMNAGQRVMSFAAENQILVSQSYFEVVSRLSDDYKNLFTLKGVETDKHIREHTVYHLSPPGAQHGPVSVIAPSEAMPLPAAAPPQPSAPPPERVAQAAAASPPVTKASGNRSMPLLIGGIAFVVVVAAAATAWQYYGSAARAKQSVSASPAAPVAAAPVAAAPVVPAPTAARPATPSPVSPAPVAAASNPPRTRPAAVTTPVASAAEEAPAPPPRARAAAAAPASPELSKADQATARDLRERYEMDASRADTARSNADAMRQRLAAKGMSLNAQTAAGVDNLGFLLHQAESALRDHRWDDALSNLQAVEAQTQKVASAVGN
jgi:class 3 adenylate cyclase